MLAALLIAGTLFTAAAGHIYAQAVSWAQTPGPFGATTKALTLAPNGHLFAASWTGGVYRSTDGGLSWTEPAPTVHFLKTHSIAAAPNGYLFAGFTSAIQAYEYNGVYRSTDNGGSWQRMPDPIANVFPTTAAAAPDGSVYIGSFDGVFRSTDNGTTWKAVGGGGRNSFVTFMRTGSDGTLYFTTSETTDPDRVASYHPSGGGKVFTIPGIGTNVVMVDVNAAGHLFVGSDKGLHRSTDHGASWALLPLSTGASQPTPYAVATDSSGILYASVVGSGVYRSEDGGASWAITNIGMLNNDVRTLVVTGGNVLHAGSWGDGAYHTTDRGAAWQWSGTGMLNTTVRTIVTARNGNVFAGTYGAGLWRTTDGGSTWTRLALQRSHILSLAAGADGSVYAGTTQGLFRSTDGGDIWEDTGAPVGLADHVVVNRNGDVFIAFAKSVTFRRTTDTAWQRWTKQTDITALAIDSAGRLYAAFRDDGLYWSADNAKTWTKGTGIGGSFSEVEDIVAGRDEAFALDNSVYRSTDGGATWVYSGGMPQQSSTFKMLALGRNGALFMGTSEDGIWRSTDHGVTWDSLNNGLFDRYIQAIATDSTGRLLAGTERSGMFRTTQSVSAVPERKAEPQVLLLMPSPNPSSTAATIRFETPAGAHAQVDLYDAAGRHVRRLIDAVYEAGTHDAVIELTRLASGTYLVRGVIGDAVYSGTVVVVR